VKQLRRDIPVLMISGHVNEMSASALEASASDFIPKPFDRDQIVSAVRPGLELSVGLVRDKHVACVWFLEKGTFSSPQ
jgi:FixJ family two-component response regulator